MSTTTTATPRKGEKFGRGVSFLKQHGFKFDVASKAWAIGAGWRCDGKTFAELVADRAAGLQITPAQYLAREGVELVGQGAAPAVSAAQNWQGQASIDHEDSHF